MSITPFHAAEVIVYSLLNLLPYLVIALLLFRTNLRFRTRGTAILVALLSIIQLGLGFCATTLFRQNASLISLLGYLIYIAFYVLAVKAPPGALAFLMLLEANYASMIVMLSKFLESRFFPQMALESYRWSFSLMTFLVQAVTLPPLGLFVYRKLRIALNLPGAKRLWRYLWLVPFTFYLVWYYSAYIASELSPLEIALRFQNAAFLLFLNLGAMVVYYTVAKTVEEDAQRLALEEKAHQLEMQNLQFSHMEDRISEARRARHDLHQHYGLLLRYSDAGDLCAIRAYLEPFRQECSADSTLVYCANQAVNAVAVFYLDQAHALNAQVSVKMELPAYLPLPEKDLAILLGNLLENAVEALRRQTSGPKFLHLTACANEMLIVTLDNSYSGEIRETACGFLSSKRSGPGIGTSSVRAMAQKYAGVAKFEHNGQVFRASVMLNLSGCSG